MRLALLALLLAPAAARAASTLVVLGERPSAAQREALEGLRAELGRGFETASADRPLPPGPHGVIVAFGGRAARRAKGSGAPLVVALAPAFRAEAGSSSVSVALTPSPERFAALLVAAGVRRLLALRSSLSDGEFTRSVAAAGRQRGVAVDDGALASLDDLPRVLRLSAAADAVWLSPDPAVVTPETYDVVREYARARRIPFFAPSPGLVKDEVRGELTVTFGECGREAGRAARELRAGREAARIVYPSPSSGSPRVAPPAGPVAAP